ncbi:MAG TPA: lipoyl synthase [Elusimicrobiales bacterium]|nr:lipoyl synthase [Elusimicrobiales bacterium]
MYPSWILEEVKRSKAELRGSSASVTAGQLAAARLRTVCQDALCPNKGRCFGEGEATFLILGGVCTRRCRFCAVSRGKPAPPDPGEPERAGRLSAEWGLRYVVFTSPTRDDLPDGGAAHFAATLREIRKASGNRTVRTEPLIPDLGGDLKALDVILEAAPDVLGHNVETVPSLYPSVRTGSDYRRSLELIRTAALRRPGTLVKSGLMLGLGETEEEVERVLADLLDHGCHILTMGQYLAPSKAHLQASRYVRPEEFSAWQEKAERMGFRAALCGPLVRSSYRAETLYRKAAGL